MDDLHLGRNVLDHQLLDKDERRCGNVDDLAIEDDVVIAIYSGPGAWPQRAGWLALRRTQVGQRMKRAVQVRRAIHEDERCHAVTNPQDSRSD